MLQARARVRLLFLEKLARFHDLQGARLRIPTLEGRRLDLHKLHTAVQREGGFEKVALHFLYTFTPFFVVAIRTQHTI